jgi:hypothetical protein
MSNDSDRLREHWRNLDGTYTDTVTHELERTLRRLAKHPPYGNREAQIVGLAQLLADLVGRYTLSEPCVICLHSALAKILAHVGAPPPDTPTMVNARARALGLES